jgi:chitinase
MAKLLVLLCICLSVSADYKRIVGYWEDWGATPTTAALANYTHMALSFIESSNTNCKVSTFDASTVNHFKSAGLKVLGSVGGASMNNYWKYCTTDNLVPQLVSIVQSAGLDGIDIDYEVDPPNQAFVVNLTQQLKAKLPAGKLITHVPENNLMDQNAAYWNITKQIASIVDFISIQYYNDNPNPVSNASGAETHYENVVTQLFNGDASKVVFGVCITECSSWNMNAQNTANIAKSLLAKYPSSFGGIQNWAENSGDISGSWSAPTAAVFGK